MATTRSLLGIDVSRWQPRTPALDGLGYLIAKATQGTTHADPMYDTHIGHALSAGLLTGAYHWGYNFQSLDAQARWFVQHAHGAQALFLDNEGAYATGRAQTRDLITAIKLADSLHRNVLLYMSEYAPFQEGVGQDGNWVAHYGVLAPTTVKNWHLHQYTSTNGTLDRNRARNLDVLNSIFKVQPPIVGPKGHTIHIAHGAIVRVYTLGPRKDQNGHYVINLARKVRWTRPSSHAPAGEGVRRYTPDGRHSTITTEVLSGAFKNQIVAVGLDGVTLS